MEITASVVKQLREKTGVGMMECKSALVEAKGDLAKAEKIVRNRRGCRRRRTRPVAPPARA